jgi:hypothetical protein
LQSATQRHWLGAIFSEQLSEFRAIPGASSFQTPPTLLRALPHNRGSAFGPRGAEGERPHPRFSDRRRIGLIEHHKDRKPTHGYAATREAAMAAFRQELARE